MTKLLSGISLDLPKDGDKRKPFKFTEPNDSREGARGRARSGSHFGDALILTPDHCSLPRAVQNFPTKYKYVALFPSNGESPLTKPEAVDVETEASRRAAKTYERAREVREKVVQAMKRGDLSSEPEVELERRGGDAAAAAGSKRLRFDFDGDGPDDDSDGDVATTSVPKPAKKSKHNSADKKSKSDAKSKSKSKESEPPAAAAAAGVQGDDFFASDDDDDE